MTISDSHPRHTRYRTIWISDVHLGTRGCQARLLLDFLRSYECEHLFLVGDIVDGWRLERAWYWPQAHNDVVQAFLAKAMAGTAVTFIPGNHDETFRQHVGRSFGSISIVDRMRSTRWPMGGGFW